MYDQQGIKFEADSSQNVKNLLYFYRKPSPTDTVHNNIYNLLENPTDSSMLSIHKRNMGLVIFGICKANSIMIQKAEERAKDPSKGDFIGTIGESVKFKGQIIDMKEIESYYGVSILVLMLDDKNNSVACFTTSQKIINLPKGEFFNFEGIVKSQEEKFGNCQTLVSRLKLSK